MLYDRVKRVLDIVIASSALIILSPVMLLIALCIKLNDGGTIFTDSPRVRVGQNGKKFFMLKFRSMIPNAHERMNEGEWKGFEKKWKDNNGKLPISEDPRITRVGKIIRRTDVDETPQFINVLMGNMSIVGPRPLPADQIERNLKKYPQIKKYLKDALSAKPGITGVWQVSGRNSIPTVEQYIMNADYAKRKSILYDLYIILKTPIAIVSRRGAYE
jgi:lipopolysaccharide/colanic/teichoic acid biosynthesis glycosyltransferase